MQEDVHFSDRRNNLPLLVLGILRHNFAAVASQMVSNVLLSVNKNDPALRYSVTS